MGLFEINNNSPNPGYKMGWATAYSLIPLKTKITKATSGQVH